MQDTPIIKSTYGAGVTVADTLNVYMSANKTGIYYANPGYHKHVFYSSVPIPMYLMALYIGDLGYLSIGTNTGVIADNAILQTAFVDFSIANVQQMLNVAEAYIGLPYIWGEFNVAIMPANFPMGQMSNPILAMMSPTVMLPYHNQAQLYVVVHAICHAWTGNIVSNLNWADLWIREGFDVFFERAVLDQLYGLDFAMTEAFIGNSSLVQQIYDFTETPSWATMHPWTPYTNAYSD